MRDDDGGERGHDRRVRPVERGAGRSDVGGEHAEDGEPTCGVEPGESWTMRWSDVVHAVDAGECAVPPVQPVAR